MSSTDLTCRSLSIVDESGACRISLTADWNSPAVFFMTRERPSICLELFADQSKPRMVLFDRNGKTRLSLVGHPSWAILAQNASDQLPRVKFAATPGAAPHFRIFSAAGQPLMTLTAGNAEEEDE